MYIINYNLLFLNRIYSLYYINNYAIFQISQEFGGGRIKRSNRKSSSKFQYSNYYGGSIPQMSLRSITLTGHKLVLFEEYNKNKVQFEQFLKARQNDADAAAERKAENVKSKLENDANYKIQFLSLLCKIRALKEEYNNIEPGFGSTAEENGLKFLYKDLMDSNQHMVQDMEAIFSNSKEAFDINHKLYDDI